MIRLPHIQSRIVRLRKLIEGLSREATAQKNDALLTPQERHSCLDGSQDVVQGLDDARHVPAAAAGRLGGEGRRCTGGDAAAASRRVGRAAGVQVPPDAPRAEDLSRRVGGRQNRRRLVLPVRLQVVTVTTPVLRLAVAGRPLPGVVAPGRA